MTPKTAQSRQNDNRVDLKDLFERVIRLEEKLDAMANTNLVTVKSFFKFAVVVIILEILNVLVHFFF